MPYVAIGAVVVIIGLLASWLWIARMRVSPQPVAMMMTRIAFPGGVRLHEPEPALAVIPQPEEIVIPFEHAILVIDYPLTRPASIEIQATLREGFTRAALVRTICEEYANVYEAEAGTATEQVPSLSLEDRAGRSRERSDGAYGIWGYELSDLRLTSLRWSRRQDGVVTIELHVES